ncbi:hypothetical protein AAAV92_10890 [Selenomonas noxia]|uniref:hypothetical protein n=1 Tax=Selenomonas noxia TaxID=135083 RepID=UPI0032C01CBB
MPISFIRKGWSKIKKGRLRAVLFVCLTILAVVLCVYGCKSTQKDNQIENTVIMTPEEATNENVLRNELKINKPNAHAAAEMISDAQRGLRRPQTVYNEFSEAGGSVTYTVKEKLDRGDPTLPPEALAKTDKTFIAEQPENKEVPVGIYKINTYRNWELGVGVGVHDDKAYIPVSLQRNYNKNHSVALELHYDMKDNKVNGGEVQWKAHF